MALVQQENTVRRDGGERYGLFCRHILRCGEHEGIIEERLDSQPRPSGGRVSSNQHQIKMAFQQAVKQRFRPVLADGEAEVRKLLLQGRENVGEQIGGHGGNDAEAQRAIWLAGIAQHETFQCFCAAQYFLCPRYEIPPERGQLDAALQPVEYGGPTLALQKQDLLGEGRLRYR